MTDSASKVNMIKNKRISSHKTSKKLNKPWFDADCRKKRKEFLRAKRQDFKGNVNIETKIKRKRAAKMYKNAIRKSVRNYQSKIAKHLRNIKSTDPKMYWNYLKDKQKLYDNKNQPECETFATMFKASSNDKENVNREEKDENINFMNYININMYTRFLNNNITNSEVMTAINRLKINKSHGLDNILNEFLKATSEKLVNIFVDIFNLILETGLMPTSWTTGLIRPIYKKIKMIEKIQITIDL